MKFARRMIACSLVSLLMPLAVSCGSSSKNDDSKPTPSSGGKEGEKPSDKKPVAAKSITPTSSSVPADLAGTWKFPGEVFVDTEEGRMVVTGFVLFENGQSTTVANCKLPNKVLIAKASVPTTYGVDRLNIEGENSNVVVEGSVSCEVTVEAGEATFEVKGNSLIVTDLKTGQKSTAQR